MLLDRKVSDYPNVMEFCQELYCKQIRSPFLLACMIDCYEEILELGKPKKEENLQKATQVRLGLGGVGVVLLSCQCSSVTSMHGHNFKSP